MTQVMPVVYPPPADGYMNPPARVLTQQELEEVERKLAKAKSLLYLDHPFFGATVAKRPIIYTDNHFGRPVNTAAMSATGQMYVNPLFIEEGWDNTPLTTGNNIFLLAHEALHFMLCHATRRGTRDLRAWNIAGDKVINDMLVEAGVGEMIEGCCWFDGARNYATEELYDEQDRGDGPNGGRPIGGIGEDIGPPCHEDGSPLDEADTHQIEAQTKIEAIQSAKAAKAVGKLPASIKRMVEELVNVSTPWDVKLERFMSGKIKDGYTWKRPNRRFIYQNLYLPGVDYKPKMGPVVIGVDTSLSIGQEELNEFNGHVNRILDTCNPEMVYVVYCDADVNHVDEYEPNDFPVKLEPHGGGGTRFDPVFDWVDKNGIDPEVIVYLTDGYGNQNNFTSSHETVWLTTHNEDFNWGTVIKFESKA